MAKRLQGSAHAKHLKRIASLAIVKELTTQVGTAAKNLSSKEGSDNDEAMEIAEFNQEDPDSCEALASFKKEDQQSIKSKSSEQQASNVADRPQSTSSVHQKQKNRKLKNLNIIKTTAERPKPEKKLKDWHTKHHICKSSKRAKGQVSDRVVKPNKKIKEIGQRFQMTLVKETFSLLNSKQS